MLIEVVGWTGAVMLLVAMYLVSSVRIDPESAVYRMLNAIGGALLAINSALHHAFASMFTNLVWLIVVIVVSFTTVRGRKLGAASELKGGQN